MRKKNRSTIVILLRKTGLSATRWKLTLRAITYFYLCDFIYENCALFIHARLQRLSLPIRRLCTININNEKFSDRDLFAIDISINKKPEETNISSGCSISQSTRSISTYLTLHLWRYQTIYIHL